MKVEELEMKTHCERCGAEFTEGSIMSMFNTEIICMECKKAEMKHPDYEKAREAEWAECLKGNYNFEGIGYREIEV